ncbi:MAG: ABC transporter permease [Clostridiales bacterium]|nr:ABC transporter permease [Clostridiales bacterium]
MLAYVRKRIIGLIVVILGVTAMTFLLIRLAPGEPAEMIAIARYGEENISDEMVSYIRDKEELDKPIFCQYIRWLQNILKGDLGVSLSTGEPVLEEILTRLPATFKLAVCALLLSVAFAIPLGVISAAHYNSITDRLTTTGAMLAESIPCFWLSLLLIILFSVNLGWLPSFGAGKIKHLVLPSVSLSVGMTAVTTRLTRSSMLEVLHQDYITTAKAKGLSQVRIVGHHALKNAMIPIVTIIGIQFSHLMEGTVIIESIFGWPGIGKLLVDSIFVRDYAMIQGCVLFFAVFVVIINLIVDLVYFLLDPKIKMKKG